MRVLVAEAFGSSESARDQARRYVSLVRELAQGLRTDDIKPIEVVAVSLPQLSDYVYFAGTSYMDEAAIARFNRVDLIFVDVSWLARWQR